LVDAVVSVQVLQGDCREVLATLPAESVHCCVTSPPYFGLRDYGNTAQIGLEPTPAEYIDQMVAVFREVRRVLRDDGTLWLNLGDSYSAGGNGGGAQDAKQQTNVGSLLPDAKRVAGYKPKNLLGIPWRVAFALQADGWYLRQDIIWHKPNPMPESVRDRCTKAHEYVFLLAKSERYFCDMNAISDPATYANSAESVPQGGFSGSRSEKIDGVQASFRAIKDTRNKRSVWTINTKPFAEAHFATMAPELAETCIKAGCPEGGTVLDPFGGAGTTGLVADQLQRSAVLVELNPEYIAIARRRIASDAPLFAEVVA
jgi:DNA modification methylase